MTVPLYLYNLPRSGSGDPGALGRRDAESTYWNLWSRKMFPAGTLAMDDHVILVQSWKGGGRLAWEVEVTSVKCERYNRKQDAITAIAQELDLDRDYVDTDKYTIDRREGAGIWLAWSGRPTRELNLPKPPDLGLQRHGWGRVTDPEQLLRWGATQRPVATPAPSTPPVESVREIEGQKRLRNGKERLAIEKWAVGRAIWWCAQQGWTRYEDTGHVKPWDLEVRRPRAGTTERFVEVKGTTTNGDTVIVTRNEVKSARTHGSSALLIVVSDIEIDRTDPEHPIASGGRLNVWDPWAPMDQELNAISYDYRPSKPPTADA